MRTFNAAGPRAAVAATVLGLGAALLLAACGGGSTITISGSDGAAVQINPSGQISVSSSDGTVVIGGAKLPDGWPSDIGQPSGFNVVAATSSAEGGKKAFSVTLSASGDQTAAVNSWLDGLVASGYTKDATLGGTSAAGSMVHLTNAQWDITSITMVTDGNTGVILAVKAV